MREAPGELDRRVLFRNLARLLLAAPLVNWWRNRVAMLPALSTMAVLLVLAGVLGVAAIAVGNAVGSATADASLLHVYLADNATPESVSALRTQLQQDPNVASVTYVSKQQAARLALSRPGLADLAQLLGSTPFPASLDVRVRDVADVEQVAAVAADDPATDPAQPTSYDVETYRALQALLTGGAIISTALIALLAVAAVVVTANAVRAALLARRVEVRVMHLVGAAAWLAKGPFLVEGAFTGLLAGVVSAVAVGITVALAGAGGGQTYVDFLPGVGPWTVALVVTILVVGGTLLGAVAGIFGVRDMET